MTGPAARGRRGRLMLILDATISRQSIWDRVVRLIPDLFAAAAPWGGIDLQLVYFRGQADCQAAVWLSDPVAVQRRMRAVTCQGHDTHLDQALAHAVEETRRHKVDAVVFVGDAVEEDPDQPCFEAGELGLTGTPMLIFQDGADRNAAADFREMARVSRGAWCPFDDANPRELAALLAAAAVFAAGGRIDPDGPAERLVAALDPGGGDP